MIFARNDLKSIYKDIQRVELGEIVKCKKYYKNSEFLCFFLKNSFSNIILQFLWYLCEANILLNI